MLWFQNVERRRLKGCRTVARVGDYKRRCQQSHDGKCLESVCHRIPFSNLRGKRDCVAEYIAGQPRMPHHVSQAAHFDLTCPSDRCLRTAIQESIRR